MAKPDLGMKRQCQNCGAKFFDLGRNPIVCPKCGTTYQAPPLARAVQRAAPQHNDEPEPSAGPVEIVSLEAAEAGEEMEAVASSDDLEIEDDDAGGDETFLEEEEAESDDVADLIDGDIENDEEP